MKNSTLPGDRLAWVRNIILSACIILSTLSGFSQLGWVQVASPNPSGTRNMIRGISGTSSSDVWAVGSYEEVFSYNPYNVQNDLLLHWNGTGWQQFPALHLSTTLDDLWDVEAISPNNVWAAGTYNDFATTRAELLHYDGSSWTNHSLPFITGGSYLYSLHALSATDIWAAGGQAGSPTRLCYVIHYNGSSWTEIAVPAVGTYRNTFNDIHGISSNDIWAAGHRGNSYGDFHALIMHWNGTTWSNVSLPSSIVTPLSEVLSIKMIASDDVWATGYYLAGGMFKIHWNGSTWTEITPTNGGGGAFAVISANNVFSVGGEISHWNGSAWTIADQLAQLSYPSLGSTVVFSNGEIWAGGVTSDATSRFFTLVYRSVNHMPLFTGGTAQSWGVVEGSVNNSPGSLLLTSDADVSQILTYSVVTAPLHGVLNGLPATSVTNNGSCIPAGVSYTPAPGFTGTDQFVIRVAAGSVHSETTISVNVSGALPVTLADFQVSRRDDQAIVKWITSSESNSQKFVIEHSRDGIQFFTAGIQLAAGNSNNPVSYNFIHRSPSPGKNYYRLKLFDLDGKTTLFPIKSIQFDEGMLQKIVLLSNPVKKNQMDLQINVPGSYLLSIYNMRGKTLLERNIKNVGAGNRYTLVLPDIAAGIYVLRVNNGRQQYTSMFMVE